MQDKIYDDPDYLDCHYYWDDEQNFEGCPGPWKDAIECKNCPYGKGATNKAMQPTAKGGG